MQRRPIGPGHMPDPRLQQLESLRTRTLSPEGPGVRDPSLGTQAKQDVKAVVWAPPAAGMLQERGRGKRLSPAGDNREDEDRAIYLAPSWALRSTKAVSRGNWILPTPPSCNTTMRRLIIHL